MTERGEDLRKMKLGRPSTKRSRNIRHDELRISTRGALH